MVLNQKRNASSTSVQMSSGFVFIFVACGLWTRQVTRECSDLAYLFIMRLAVSETVRQTYRVNLSILK